MSLSVDEAKELVGELCRLFYKQGWVSGTGGGISIKAGDQIVMAPSGVQKERMQPSDMFVLNTNGDIVHTPAAKPLPNRPPKLSECSPLFMAAYELRNAGGVIHSHSVNAVLATMLRPEADEFVVTHLEMIKGLEGHGFYGKLVIPIIENTARECELTDRLRQAIADYPMSHAVLVRRHGVYIWGKDWIQAKTQAECYDYLFEMAVKMHQLGMDPTRPPAPIRLTDSPITAVATDASIPAGKRARTAEAVDASSMNGHANGNGLSSHVASGDSTGLGNGTSSSSGRTAASLLRGAVTGTSPPLPTAIVLDIEGTVAPISYVADVMFPYALKFARTFLSSTYSSAETQADLQLIRQQAADDVAAAVPGVSAVPPAEGSSQQEVVDAAVAWVEAATAADRKIAALKTLQGHIWRTGFERGDLRSELFRDVPDALVQWRAAGLKTYIYSSGSREAQRLFFGYSQVGDLRPYLCGFFDTTSGPKASASSYNEIRLSLGVDAASELLFATDVLAEAVAAQEAGWRAVLVVRPGNKPLPEGHGFKVVHSMQDLLA